MQQLYEKIDADPQFHALQHQRSLFSWCLIGILLIAYFAFILIIAFAPELLAHPLTENTVITWGILVGVSIIIMSFLLTGIYVWRSNKVFDPDIRQVITRYMEQQDSV